MGQLVTITNPSSNFNPPPVKHYEAYRPKPFTRAERETTTLLFGGLTWKHERMMQGASAQPEVQGRTAAEYRAGGPGCGQRVDRCGRLLSHHFHDRKPGELPEEGSRAAWQGADQPRSTCT